MGDPTRVGLDHNTLLAYQKQYHAQKRLSDALFGLFRTLGSALQVERVVNVGLLTLTGQLLIKCAGFFQRRESSYVLLATVGARDPRLAEVEIPADLPLVTSMFEDRSLLDLQVVSGAHPSLARLRSHGFASLFPLADGAEPLGIIALGDKIVPGPRAAEDLQILDAFGVVIAVSLKNSVAFQIMESSRNELERLNEMKREFLSHVSHEFRTPLTILKNIFDMIELEPEIEEMQASSLARLEHLINTILLLNEINSSGLQLDAQILDGPAWVDSDVRRMLEKHGRFELISDLPSCTLEFDSFKVGLALESVVNNAAKFGGDRPREVHLYLTTRPTVAQRLQDPRRDSDDLAPGYLRPAEPIVGTDPDTVLAIEVKDAGIGIPRAELAAVFQPFTQAANSPTRGVRGAGLGLAMAKRIVDAHGGEIFCRSAMGQGTIFYIAVPAAPTGGAGAARAPSP
jgi:signal transduction histidine kinase